VQSKSVFAKASTDATPFIPAAKMQGIQAKRNKKRDYMQSKKYIVCAVLLLLYNKTYPDVWAWAKRAVKNLTLEEKIGQLFIAATIIDANGKEDLNKKIKHNIDKTPITELIKKYHIGGVLFLRKTTTPQVQAIYTHNLQKISKLPLFIAQDLEWGLSMRLHNTTKFPYNMTLGAIQNNNLLYEMGKEIGRQCKLIGVNINFAPVIDINSNPKNPIINKRSFGENKYNVAQKAVQFMRGLQDAGVIACAKHFPGHGDTSVDSHIDLPKVNHSLARLQTIELYPFAEIISKGVLSIMTAHLEVPALETTPQIPATLSVNIVTKLLKNTLGFTGLTITDALNMQGVLKHHTPGELELKALQAGNDILLCPTDTPRAIAYIKQAIKNGDFPQSELDKKVEKILRAKTWVLQNSTNNAPEKTEKNLETQHTYDLIQKLYNSAITLVQDKKNLIPIKNNVKNTLPNQIIHIQVGQMVTSKANTHFDATLEQLLNIKKYILPRTAKLEHIQKILLKLQNTETIIISVYAITKNIINFINLLNTQKKNIILVLFTSPYTLQLFESIESIGTIIQAYENNKYAEIAAGKIILGEITPKGMLPVTASEKFYAGLGVTF